MNKINIPAKVIWCLSLILTGCHTSFPNDPENTLTEIIQSKILKVGMCQQISESERNLLLDLAKSLSVNIIWTVDNQENLYRDLEEHKIHIVSCTINQKTPWKEKITLTQPYFIARQNNDEIKYVFALQQGENRWLKYVNELIQQQGH